MILTAEQRATLIEIIAPIMQRVYQDDIRLIQRGGMERSLSFRFGLYLSDAIRQNEWLSNLHLDLEYNKNGLNPKRTPRRPNGAQPDLILHTREGHVNNILVIEFKGWWNDYDRQRDRIKLEDFVDQEGEYKYGLGILIELNIDAPTYEYFQDY
jgi:hypothetical protein